MPKYLLASNNPHKLSEITAQLAGSTIQVVTPAEVGVPAEFDVAETGTTFAANAELKARAFSELTGLPAIGDDSGLCVAALDGQPGVHSKRWIPGSDADRNTYLLTQLKNFPQPAQRGSAFITVLALVYPSDPKTIFFEGRVDGKIAAIAHGEEGFGYDPLFIPDGYQHTFAELGVLVKNQLSHRARAVHQLCQYLANPT